LRWYRPVRQLAGRKIRSWQDEDFKFSGQKFDSDDGDEEKRYDYPHFQLSRAECTNIVAIAPRSKPTAARVLANSARPQDNLTGSDSALLHDFFFRRALFLLDSPIRPLYGNYRSSNQVAMGSLNPVVASLRKIKPFGSKAERFN